MSNEIKVAELSYYPIKSCAGTTKNIEGESIKVAEKGFEFDRRWLIVNPSGKFLTQREFPQMALIVPRVEDNNLIVAAKGERSLLEIPLQNEGNRVQVEVWGNVLDAIDEGETAAQWFSDYLGIQARFVHMADDFERRKGQGRFQFADSYPFLIGSQESLDDLSRRITQNAGNPIEANRFNINVKGAEPYAEDGWKRIQVGEVQFELVKPCVRCPIPTIDQQTALRGKEPLKTLAQYRRISIGEKQSGVIFAQKAIHLNQGVIAIGNNIEVIETKVPPFN